jgi:spore germination protein
MPQSQPLSTDLEQNIALFETIFSDCKDILRRPMTLGSDGTVKAFFVYIEVTLGENSLAGKMLNHLWNLPSQELYASLKSGRLGISDVQQLKTMEEAVEGLLAGDAILFLDGYGKALKMAGSGFPSMGVSAAEEEKVLRGSKEAFSDSVKSNSALIRKRLRHPGVKLQEIFAGKRSNTLVNLMYMEDLVDKERLQTLKEALGAYEIDGVLDSGTIEQLAEKKWYSPFPQFQTTERPDRAAKAILDGRVVLLSDNSPMALLLPTDLHCFFQAADDDNSRFEIVSLQRILRYLGGFLAMVLPGLYLAVTTFHTQVLPTHLLLTIGAARQGIPFSPLFELLFMELAFELLREAGVRLPGVASNTIGIVGGLIVGQTAVEAHLVSTMVVVVVAMTALASFTLPNQEFSDAVRLIKFFLIFCGGFFGFFGIAVGLLLVLIHLSHLKSFGIPYLMPFTGADLNDYHDQRNNLIRWPLRKLTRRPIFASPSNRIRLKKKKSDPS